MPKKRKSPTGSCLNLLALKSVKQTYRPTLEIQRLLEIFHHMVNDCIEIGISYDAASLKRLSVLSWPQRRKYDCPSYYKASAVSRAAGILASRKKSLRRGIPTKNPYSLRPQITAYQGFRVKDGTLRVPIGKRSFEYVPLTSHTASILLDPAVTVRSFTLTPTSLSLCISKEVPEVECTEAIAVDRNLRNLTVGNDNRVIQYDLSDTVRIVQTTVDVVGCSGATIPGFERRLLQSTGCEDETEYNTCFTTLLNG